MGDNQQKIQILISEQALNRFKKDKFLRQNKRWYNSQIAMLRESRLNRPAERIWDFNITPRGHEKRRIAWHFEVQKDSIILFIDDLVYHITEDKYVDNWNIKAGDRKITLKDYGPYPLFINL